MGYVQFLRRTDPSPSLPPTPHPQKRLGTAGLQYAGESYVYNSSRWHSIANDETTDIEAKAHWSQRRGQARHVSAVQAKDRNTEEQYVWIVALIVSQLRPTQTKTGAAVR